MKKVSKKGSLQLPKDIAAARTAVGDGFKGFKKSGPNVPPGKRLK